MIYERVPMYPQKINTYAGWFAIQAMAPRGLQVQKNRLGGRLAE